MLDTNVLVSMFLFPSKIMNRLKHNILISGDKDFSDVEIEKPEILTPAEFLEQYG